jgi:hypothetical protein
MTAPVLIHRDPRVDPALGDRYRREDFVQVDIWNLYTEGGEPMVSIVAAEKSGQLRETFALEEFRIIAAGWRVVWVAGYTPRPSI